MRGARSPWWPRRREHVPGGRSGGDHVLSRILVVDDDPSIVAVVTDILVAEGHEIVSAENGAEALAKVNGEALVLLDMRMPVLDGWGFARQFRASGKRSPIVVMTAAENARRWAEEIGAEGYLAKPFEIDALIAAVERYATGRH